MNKKIFAITLVTILIAFGATTVSNAKMSIQHSVKEKPAILKKEISLGSATIYGDGIEGNTNVVAVAREGLTIEIGSNQENVDFNISYSIQCDGEDDIGIAVLLVQLGGVSLGYNSVFTSESKEGDIKIEDALVKRGDLLTYEVIALYINTDPTFTRLDADAGGALIIKSRNIHNRLYGSPLVQLLQKLPLLSR